MRLPLCQVLCLFDRSSVYRLWVSLSAKLNRPHHDHVLLQNVLLQNSMSHRRLEVISEASFTIVECFYH